MTRSGQAPPNALLLTWFAMRHFAGDWTTCLPFALWTNSKSVKDPDDTSHHGCWLTFKVGGEEDQVDQGAGARVGGTGQTCSITRPLNLVHLTLGACFNFKLRVIY